MSNPRHMGKITIAALLFLSVSVATAATVNSNYSTYKQRLNAGEITPLGAKRAGNAAGTIPEWQCDKDGTPPGIDVAPADIHTDTYPAMKNPFADEKPRFVITASNYKKYKDKLTPGTVKLLKSYPDSFRMPVYPTHRTACFSNKVYKQARLNAKHAHLVNNGNGLSNSFLAPPFPLPENGLQALWNNLVLITAYREDSYRDSVSIFSTTGRQELGRNHTQIYAPYSDPTLSRQKYLSAKKKVIQEFVQDQFLPERGRGTLTVGQQFLHTKEHIQSTWQYLPGTRRVRRAPFFGYDTPQGVSGLRGVDEQRLFNGSPNRFSWKLIGKKEIFVPYNDYALDSDVNYKRLLGPHVVDPSYTRWELHRVWEVVGTLKPGNRHWYKKRVLYIDEDSGHALLADNYDHHDVLWRTSQQNYVWTPLLTVTQFARPAIYYDFETAAYNVQSLINELPQSRYPHLGKNVDFGQSPSLYFTPATIRRQGIH